MPGKDICPQCYEISFVHLAEAQKTDACKRKHKECGHCNTCGFLAICERCGRWEHEGHAKECLDAHRKAVERARDALPVRDRRGEILPEELQRNWRWAASRGLMASKCRFLGGQPFTVYADGGEICGPPPEAPVDWVDDGE